MGEFVMKNESSSVVDDLLSYQFDKAHEMAKLSQDPVIKFIQEMEGVKSNDVSIITGYP
jgi:hypothetical protein